jgi:hypothetical protein
MPTGISLRMVRAIKSVPAEASGTDHKIIIQFDDSASISNLFVVAGVAVALINERGISDVGVEAEDEAAEQLAVTLSLPKVTSLGFIYAVVDDLAQRAREKGASLICE